MNGFRVIWQKNFYGRPSGQFKGGQKSREFISMPAFIEVLWSTFWGLVILVFIK